MKYGAVKYYEQKHMWTDICHWPSTEIREGKIYRTENHADGYTALPQYEIRGYYVYRSKTYVDGFNDQPQYIIR